MYNCLAMHSIRNTSLLETRHYPKHVIIRNTPLSETRRY